jgi:hypothetical protein
MFGGGMTSAAEAAIKKTSLYRSGKPLRHPKASATAVKLCATQRQVQRRRSSAPAEGKCKGGEALRRPKASAKAAYRCAA